MLKHNSVCGCKYISSSVKALVQKLENMDIIKIISNFILLILWIPTEPCHGKYPNATQDFYSLSTKRLTTRSCENYSVTNMSRKMFDRSVYWQRRDSSADEAPAKFQSDEPRDFTWPHCKPSYALVNRGPRQALGKVLRIHWDVGNVPRIAKPSYRLVRMRLIPCEGV